MASKMDWLRDALIALREGRSALVHPGDFFFPADGRLVVVDPVRPEDISTNDVLFVRWKSAHILQVAKWVEAERLLVANRTGSINGWIFRGDVLGRLNEDETNARRHEADPQASTLVFSVQVLEQDAQGKTVGYLCHHSERYSSNAGCPINELRFRERLVASAYQAFLDARDAPWSEE